MNESFYKLLNEMTDVQLEQKELFKKLILDAESKINTSKQIITRIEFKLINKLYYKWFKEYVLPDED